MLNRLEILLILFTLVSHRLDVIFQLFKKSFLLHVLSCTVDLGIVLFIIFENHRIVFKTLYPALNLVQTILDYLCLLFYFRDFFEALCLNIGVCQDTVFKLFDAAIKLLKACEYLVLRCKLLVVSDLFLLDILHQSL